MPQNFSFMAKRLNSTKFYSKVLELVQNGEKIIWIFCTKMTFFLFIWFKNLRFYGHEGIGLIRLGIRIIGEPFWMRPWTLGSHKSWSHGFRPIGPFSMPTKIFKTIEGDHVHSFPKYVYDLIRIFKFHN